MNSSLRASILARDSEDHGTVVDAQAGVFGEGQSDQWICPILFSWVWAANGMPYFPDPKRRAICSPTPQIFRTGSKTSITEHLVFDIHLPVSQYICHSRWNFRDAMI